MAHPGNGVGHFFLRRPLNKTRGGRVWLMKGEFALTDRNQKKPFPSQGPRPLDQGACPEDSGNFFAREFGFQPKPLTSPSKKETRAAWDAHQVRRDAGPVPAAPFMRWGWGVAALFVVAFGSFLFVPKNMGPEAPNPQSAVITPAPQAQEVSADVITPSLSKVEGGVELNWEGEGEFKISKCVDPAFKRCSVVKQVQGNRFVDTEDQEAPLIFYRIEAAGKGGSA